MKSEAAETEPESEMLVGKKTKAVKNSDYEWNQVVSKSRCEKSRENFRKTHDL